MQTNKYCLTFSNSTTICGCHIVRTYTNDNNNNNNNNNNVVDRRKDLIL